VLVDLLVRNADIVTMDPQRPRALPMAVYRLRRRLPPEPPLEHPMRDTSRPRTGPATVTEREPVAAR
jgi:hypothetical protein